MIPADSRHIIRRVGFKNFDTRDIQDDNFKPVTEDKIVDVVTSLQKSNAILNYYIHGNFSFSTLGCSGFVAELELSRAFNCDLMYSWLFRVNFVCEIEIADEKAFLDGLKERKPAIRSAILYDPAVCMNDTSTIDGVWSPALGRHGGLIGVGVKQDYDKGKDMPVNRFFVYGRSGIHDNYVNALLDRAHNKSGANVMPGSSLFGGFTSSTFRSEFSKDGVFANAIELARENCRRLVRVMIDTIGAYTANSSVEVNYVGSLEEPNFYDIPPLTSAALRDKKQLSKVLPMWPVHATIYPYSTLQTSPSDPLNGYEIGAVVFDEYLSTDSQAFMAELAKAELKFDPFPRSFEELHIESVFNTFDVTTSSTVTWYSNCTPIDNHTGIAVQRSIRAGFSCINSPLFSNNIDATWGNDYGNAFPVVFPFKQGPATASQEGTVIFDNKGDLPEQLSGTFPGSDQLDEPKFQRAMGDSTGTIIPGALITPVLVFCSPHVEKSNSFSLYNNHT